VPPNKHSSRINAAQSPLPAQKEGGVIIVPWVFYSRIARVLTLGYYIPTCPYH